MMGFLIKYRIPVIILFYLFQFTWISSQKSLLHWQEMDFLAWLSFLFLFGFWLILLLDMINERIYNKTFWMIAMLIMPWLAPSFYLFQRKTSIRPESSLFNRRGKIG